MELAGVRENLSKCGTLPRNAGDLAGLQVIMKV